MLNTQNFTDSTLDIVLLVALGISLLISIKVWFERQAIRKGGRIPNSAGSLWLPLSVILAVILLVINR